MVSGDHPRCFLVASSDGAAVYLTGSHIWNNSHTPWAGRRCSSPSRTKQRSTIRYSRAAPTGSRDEPEHHGASRRAQLDRVRAGERRRGDLVLDPEETGDRFTAMLSAGIYAVEWYSVNSRETMVTDEVKVESSSAISFSAPFEVAGPSVLYLKRVGR